jgi:ATP-dependent helicase HrpA
VRFTDQVGDDTYVKLMTDGILLAEIQRDRELRRYDTIIIDEAHERSLNIDFLLGYLKQLLPRAARPQGDHHLGDDRPERFAEHFGDARRWSRCRGRTYPVEVRYRPVGPTTTTRASRSTTATRPGDRRRRRRAGGRGARRRPRLPLRRAGDPRHRRRAARGSTLRATPSLPLYARLSAAEQHRSSPHTGRRIVLATNVAETSLTVPGIRYVVDPGTARISRYSRAHQGAAAADRADQPGLGQPAGRPLRPRRAGHRIRLYSEEDFDARPEFTDPEILRTNLASVILQMTALGLGDIAAFPFVEPPDRATSSDGVQLLEELGASTAADRGTASGSPRSAAAGRGCPIDPRLGRMVLEADRHGCVREVLVIAAALSIQDPRERPRRAAAAGRPAARPVRRPDSDFLAWLNLWRYLQEQQKELSRARSGGCASASTSTTCGPRVAGLRVGQLRQVAKEMKLEVGRSSRRRPRRRRHPPGAALRAAQPHRAAGGARGGSTRQARTGRKRPMREYLGARGAGSRSSPAQRAGPEAKPRS